MLDPRYMRYLGLLAYAAEEPKAREVVEANETLVYAQLIRDARVATDRDDDKAA